VQDKATLPDAIREYSYHIGPGSEFNEFNEVGINSRRRDEEHRHNKYKISSRHKLVLPTGGVVDV